MKPQIIERFAKRLRGLRSARGITQEQLAYKAGLDRSYFGAVERGERNVSLANIGRIAEALGVPIQKLFSSSSNKSKMSKRK